MMRVLMADCSSKDVRDLAISDLVMGYDGLPRKIEELYTSTGWGYRLLNDLEVSPDYIMSLRTTADVVDGIGREFKSGSVCNISVSDYLKSSKTFRDNVLFWHCTMNFSGKIDLDKMLDPYELGLFLMYDEFFETFDLVGYKRIPRKYLTATTENRLDLLAGMIEIGSDIVDNHFTWTTTSHDLMMDFQFLVGSLGFIAQSYVMEDGSFQVMATGNVGKVPLIKKRPEIDEPILEDVKLERIEDGEYRWFKVKEDNKLVLSSDFVVCYA